MAIITEEKMQNLDRDIEDAGKTPNTDAVIIPRYGEPYKSFPMVSREGEEGFNAAIQKIEKEGGFISAPTLAALQAITPTYNHQVGRDDSTGNEYRWNPAATPTPLWEPTGRNFLNDSKAYADTITNINLYRGNGIHNSAFNATTFDKTTTKIDYGSTGFRYKNANLTGGVNIPFNGELRTKVQVWVKVTSAALNSGTMRFLVQAIKNDGTNFLSQYTNIPDGTVGWFKLAEVALSEANRAVFNRVTITPQVISGADLSGNDYYVGESVPTVPFVRVREPLDRIIARTATRKSLLPTWKSYPAATGVTINENGDITIAPGISYPITFTVENASRINYCGYIDQVATGDCRLFFRGYRAATPTTFHDVPYFPTSIGGIEFLGAVQFDALVSSVQLTINNYSTTDSITLRSFDICYDPVATNGKLKIGDRLDLTKVKSDIIQAVAANKPQQNFSTFPNFEVVAKSADGKRYAVNNAVYQESVKNGGIKQGVKYYISLPDSIATLGTGTAKLTVFHIKADGTSLGGASTDFALNGGVINRSITTTSETAAICLRIDLTGNASVQLGKVIISDVIYSPDLVFQDYFSDDKTGTIISEWAYPKLTGFTKQGLAVDYPILEEDGDPVLVIPNTAAPDKGQGVKYIVDLPLGAAYSTFITFLAKTNYSSTNPTKCWIRYFREGSATEISAVIFPLIINRDGSWTLNRIALPAQLGGFNVKYVELYLYNDSTATEPLYLKRFIQTQGIHNPYVKFIKSLSEKAVTGLSDFLRLKDALGEQPQTVFSVGRQMFRPLKTVQQTVSDYELINGQSLLPKRLYNLRHIDTDGYLIAFIDRDDNVYLKKGTALYKTTVDDLSSRCVSTSIVGDENRGVFNSTNLPLINPNIPGQWLRVTGNGTLVSVSRSTAHYSIDGGQNWIEATGYQNTNGDNYNAWGVDCSDDIVITSGYKLAAEGRGTGRINFSKDNGKTYQVILDIETSSFIDNARRGSMHIHSVKYDPYWEGVWVIMGDGAFNNPNTSVTSNVWFIENPGTAQQNMISYDCRGQDWTNEQHVSVFPMQDCILFGSDAAPTGLYRMARTKDVKAFRDVAVPISTALSHYGCGGYQHQHYLPAAIYFGKAGESTVSLNDKVFLTYDGVNIVEIYTEPETSNMPSGKVNSFAFALDKYFIFERRTDARFASGNTWIISDIQYMR
ncbi:hypothetical protein JUNP543_1300 [Acinetobacter baumannii]|uniref:hypothetical protein n=1 Tax=Acinetobacter baumannii TaxID=470 RepID=UPI001DD77A90|nr:hypothetical protein [Acinetobacter baumannii]HAV6088173.1 hypothetical protein [Acinetobacter baumannii]HAV6092368.1 hypothetical protein [Acinetobacter baumannii]HAV6097300.1 hypothetical protein [Acinetobacter baumannii]HAV6163673.1 hypothetical protein [Acinetobacter baumannii]